MPRQSTTRTSKTTRAANGGTRRGTTTTATRRGNGPKAGNGPRNNGGEKTGTVRRPNGFGKGNGPRNGNTVAYWSLELVDGNNAIDVIVAGKDGEHSLTGCTRCGSILLDTDTAKKLHSRWHEVVDAVDQRAG